MFKRIASTLLAAIMVVLTLPMFTAVAATETADFEGLGYANFEQIFESNAVEGFRFSTASGEGMEYSTSYGSSGSAGIVARYAGPIEWVSFRRSDSGDFALRSLYYDATPYTGATQYRFDGYLDGDVVETTGNVAISGTNTISFSGWDQVDAVRITATAGTYIDVAAVFDDLVYETITVSPVPYLEINSVLTGTEGGTTTITNAILKANDHDTVAGTLQYTVTTALTHGRLENSDSPGVAISTFTQGNIDSGKIRYVHDHTDTTSDSFVFRVSDGVNQLTGQTFNITVTQVYDDPLPTGASVATFDGLGGTYTNGTAITYTTAIDGFAFRSSLDLGMTYYSTGGQDNTPVLKTSGTTYVTGLTIKRSDNSVFKLFTMFLYDSGTTGSTLYTFKGYLGGAEVYTKADVNVKTPVKVTFDWENIDEIRVSVTGTGADILAVFDNIVYKDSISSPVPYVETNSAVTVAEGGTVSITNSSLKANDNDTVAGTLQYTVTTALTHGRLENSDSPGVAITTFTQGNIDSGKIHYVHDHTDTTSDSFGFKVSDGTYEVTGKTFNINVTPVYDDPLPPGATVAKFDDLGGTYISGETIPYTTAIDNFAFRSSANLGMTYYSSGGQDNTPALRTTGTSSITSLSIKKSDNAVFKLFTMFLYDNGTTGSTLYTFKGYLAGTEVYTKADVNVKSPVKVNFDWENIDEIRVSVTGTGADIVALFDNIVYRNNNVAPVASDVQLTGTATYGQELSGSYTYGDAESDAQGTSTFKWYRADNASGLNQAAISGAVTMDYTLTTADVGKYIGFGVTPVAATGTITGAEVITYTSSAVQKETTTITAKPTASAIIYGDSLSDSTLSDGSASVAGTFNWTTGATEPAVSDSDSTAYSVTFTPTDSASYATTTAYVTITVGKATPSITTAPTASAITYGQALSDSMLSGGDVNTAGTFSWTTGTTEPSVSDSGVTEYSVTFTPTDSENFNEATTTVTLTVNKATPSITTAPTASDIMYGQALSNSMLLGGSASVEGTFSWTTGTTEPSVSDSNLTAYSVTFTPTDITNYGPATTTVTIIVKKATPTITTLPTASAITYGESLSDSSLTGGSASVAGTFSWTAGTTKPSVMDSGTTEYSVTFTPTDSDNYNETTTTVTLIVNQETPIISSAPAASAITYGQALSDSTLTGGSASVEGTFSWTAGSTEPSVADSGTTEYSVTFTPADSANYGPATTTVTLIVNKAKPMITTAPTASAITYGEALSDSLLTDGSASVAGTFSWTTGTTEPSVSDSGVTAYSVTFTPKDTDNYNTTTTTVTLTVNKATPMITSAPSASAITYGQALSDSLLTGGSASVAGAFSWTNGTITPSVSDSGITQYPVTFTPADSNNYNATTTGVTLIVNKATPIITTAPTASAITYGESLSESYLTGGSVSVEGTFTWTTDTTEPYVADSGTTAYSVTFTPSDIANYTVATTTVTLIVNKATPTITTLPTASDITYGQALLDSILTDGSASVAGMFSWTAGTTKPSTIDSGVTGYSVTFTPKDTDNYNTATTTVTLIINKADAESPVSPALSGKTEAIVLLVPVTGYEYLRVANDADVSTGTWQDSYVFTGLSSTTAYDFYQRIKETSTHNASDISLKLDVTTANPLLTGTANITGSPVFGQTLTASLTGSNNTGTLSYQWVRGSSDIVSATGSTYTLVQADIGYQITVKINSSFETGTVTGAPTSAVQKADASAAVAPVLTGKTQKTVTLTAVAGYEYIKVKNGSDISTGTWQDSSVFSGLSSGTAYDFYQRIKETATVKASAASSKLDVTTVAASEATPTPAPTSTPKPTATPVPTATSTPTPEPEPTSTPTPEPTATNTPTGATNNNNQSGGSSDGIDPVVLWVGGILVVAMLGGFMIFLLRRRR